MPQPIGNLPINAKIKFGTIYGRAIQWMIKSKYHAGYPSGAITIVTEKIIKLMASDAREASNSDSNRRSYGNNRHIHSNIRQWLNKSTSPWYVSQHGADAPPTKADCYNYNGYDNIPGFLSGFTADEIAAILTTTLTVNKASVDGGGQDTYTDKMFLLSGTEVGFSTDTAEGSLLEGFDSTNGSRLAYPTADAVANSDYSNSSFNVGAAWYWWLRGAYASHSHYVRNVSTDGTLSDFSACNGYGGARPACNLASTYLVSDSTDSDGCYTLIFNQPPTLPEFITVPGNIAIGATPEITWGSSTDPEGTAVTYILERKFNSGAWAEIYSGVALTHTDSAIPSGNTSVQYRVKVRDADGVECGYVTSASRSIVQNTAPGITGADADLGTFANQKPPAYNYTVTDPDGDVVTVFEKVDDVTIRTYQPALGVPQSFAFTDQQWQAVINGTHTIKIIAQDPSTGQTTRTLSFTKNVNSVEFYGPITPYVADGRPTEALVQVSGAFPPGCILNVRICNNGNDPDPVWEDCTTAVLNNELFNFTNLIKTAAKWGVKLHVRLQRGSAASAVYISSVGGRFR